MRFEYPAGGGFTYSGGVCTARLTSLVLVHTDSGEVGIGSAYSHPGLVYLVIKHHLEPLLRGDDPRQVVALKTCKTQTGALLTACWAKAHGMTLMVQDLSNAMLAQMPHVLLASQVGTIMGVESNGMQFYPAVSESEAHVHPGLYRRREGVLDLSTLGRTGFGYRIEEIERTLPAPAATTGEKSC